MVMHVPGVRDMPDSAAMNSLKDNLPARTSSLNSDIRAGADVTPAEFTVQHRTG